MRNAECGMLNDRIECEILRVKLTSSFLVSLKSRELLLHELSFGDIVKSCCQFDFLVA